ncbi:hypothetical protein V8G54_002957 [Vigna mungo]|uniref:Uncharacterized protein n=1 Tax=Vigna mungo TaxID=3915 RepID=A0AAQ3PD18_VIGMU
MHSGEWLITVYCYTSRRARCSALVNMIKMIIPSRRLALQGEDTQRNIEANAGAFGHTVVKSMTLHWNQEDITNLADTFDIVIASDCCKPVTAYWKLSFHVNSIFLNLYNLDKDQSRTKDSATFFKDFHRDLARIVKHLLSKAGSSEAILLSPKRGNSLDLFLEVAKENGLRFSVTENYDQEVWKRHEGFLSEDRDSWPSYEKDNVQTNSETGIVLIQTLTDFMLSLRNTLFCWLGHIFRRQHYTHPRRLG